MNTDKGNAKTRKDMTNRGKCNRYKSWWVDKFECV